MGERMILRTLLKIGLVGLLLSEVACTLLPSPLKVVRNYRTTAVLPQNHIVQKGETLYKISQYYQINMNLIAQLNRLTPPYLIYPGQTLQLTVYRPPAPNNRLPVDSGLIKPAKPITPPVTSRPTQAKKQLPRDNITQPTTIALPPITQQQRCYPPINWQLPTTGTVIKRTTVNGKNGLEIFGYIGQPIRASAAGQIIYSDNGVTGYHNLIIIQHNAAYLSAYANNRIRLVREGEYVAAGQIIAEMGNNTDYQASLHFEIRCYTKTLDPLPYLPK